MTFHPGGGQTSSTWFHQADWLDFNMLQSGHSAQSTNYVPVERDYALAPPKPTLDGEPAYEYPPDAMPAKRPVGALQVRRNAYWAIFAGAFGHTYGTHPIWQMYDEGRGAAVGCRDALAPGSRSSRRNAVDPSQTPDAEPSLPYADSRSERDCLGTSHRGSIASR
jgi:hypothetical protein